MSETEKKARRGFFHRSRRWVRRGIRTLLILVLAVVGVGWFALRIPAVQDRVLPLVNRRLAVLEPYSVQLEGLRGTPPLHIRLDAIRISDSEGLWGEARDLYIRISGRSALIGRLRIREISAEDAVLYRLPQAAERAPRPERKEDPAPPFPGIVSLDRLSVSRFTVHPTLPGFPGEDPATFRLDASAYLSPVEGMAATVRVRKEGSSPTRLWMRVQGDWEGAPIRIQAHVEESAGGWLGRSFPWPVEGEIRVETEASLQPGFAHGDVVFRSGALGRGRIAWRAERTENWEADAEIHTRGLSRGSMRVDIPRLTLRAWLKPGAERLSFEGVIRDRRAFATVRAEAWRTPDRFGVRDIHIESGPARLQGFFERRFVDGLVDGRLEAHGIDPAALPFMSAWLPGGIPEAWALGGTAEAVVEARVQDSRQAVAAELAVSDLTSAWAGVRKARLHVQAQAPWDQPHVHADLNAESVNSELVEFLWPDGWETFQASATWEQGRLSLSADADTDGFHGHVQMGTTVTPADFPAGADEWAEHPIDGSLDVTLQAERLPMEAVSAVDALRGQLALQLDGSGSWQNPVLEGRVAWTDGSLSLPDIGSRLTGIHVVLVGAENTLRIEDARAEDGSGGTLSAQGSVTIPALNRLPRIAMAVESHDVRILDLPIATGRISGTVEVAPDEEGVGHRVTGTIQTRSVDLRIPARLPPHIPDIPIVERGMPPPAPPEERRSAAWLDTVDTDIALRVRRLQARGRGLDSEWEGRLRLTGPISDPHVIGGIQSVRGRLHFLGRRFRIEEAALDWSGPIREPPTLLCRATARTGGVRAWVEIQGALDAPVIRLHSDPPGPEDEVLSRVLFGRGLDRLSPFQAVRLAHGLRVIQGEGDPWDIMARGQDILRVDQIDIVQDEEEGEGPGAVAVGKYVGDIVYVEGAMGLGETRDRVSVEIELTPALTLETETRPGLREGIRLRWSYDY